jgi:AraC family transcriptional regulator, melibiose operon regulatory protein
MDVPFAVAENFQEITRFGNDDFPVESHVEELKKEVVRPHWHNEFQFMLAREKTTVVTAADQSFVLDEGDGMFINAGVSHSTKAGDGISSSYTCIMMHPKFIYGLNNSMFKRYYVTPVLESKAMSVILFHESIPWHRTVIDLLKKVDIEFRTKEYTYMLTVQQLFLELWTLILTYNSNRLNNTATAAMSLVDKERMDKMLSYIVRNIHRKIDLTMIAQEGCISNSECCRLFRRTANISPMEYVNNTRLLEAARLLTTTKKSVTEIAYEVGFTSPSYFSEQFGKFMNCRPLEYRKKHC